MVPLVAVHAENIALIFNDNECPHEKWKFSVTSSFTYNHYSVGIEALGIKEGTIHTRNLLRRSNMFLMFSSLKLNLTRVLDLAHKH